ncbi:MAG: hypothetical protein WBN31_04430 [Gammaproteobacteria bacterium]
MTETLASSAHAQDLPAEGPKEGPEEGETIFESMEKQEDAAAVLRQLEELNQRFRATFAVDSDLVPQPSLEKHQALLNEAKQLLAEVLERSEDPVQRASVLGGITAGLAIGSAVHRNQSLMRQHYQALTESINDDTAESGGSRRQLWLAQILGDLLDDQPEGLGGKGLKNRVWRRYQRKFGKNAETFRRDWRALWRRNRGKNAA